MLTITDFPTSPAAQPASTSWEDPQAVNFTHLHHVQHQKWSQLDVLSHGQLETRGWKLRADGSNVFLSVFRFNLFTFLNENFFKGCESFGGSWLESLTSCTPAGAKSLYGFRPESRIPVVKPVLKTFVRAPNIRLFADDPVMFLFLQ